MFNKNSSRPRSTTEDHIRAVGYLFVMVWAVVFMLYPPSAFVSTLDFFTRLFWLSLTFIGAFVSFIGSLTRIDIKMEFPGLILVGVGPLFYFASQVYYVIYPPIINGVLADPSQRYALIIYAVLPGLFLLPRTYALYAESRRLKKINDPKRRVKLTPEQEAMPGAFKISLKGGR